ncbi:hypothetical protein LEAN103870_06595 [Legionella anisa]|nr:hypothetical protein Lani_2437 [Legionella anisa]
MFCTCAPNTSILEGANGSHKFRHPSLQTRPRLQPRPLVMVRHQYNLAMSCCLPRPETCRLVATSHFSGLQRSPFDLGSNVSLSTLRPHCCRRARKTRYIVVLATPSMTGLSPARWIRLSCRTRDPDEKDRFIFIFIRPLSKPQFLHS